MTPHNHIGKLYLSAEVPNDGYLNLDWDFEKAYRFLRALDYRGMNVMPPPKIELKGETFCIESYSVENCHSPKNSMELRITAEGSNKCLSCRLKKCE